MTRVDFYILQASQLSDRLYFCCRLAEKALRNKLRILLWLPDADYTRKLDNLLWSYIPESFIPHIIANEATAEQKDMAPVVLTHQTQPMAQDNPNTHGFDMLINLRGQNPEWTQDTKTQTTPIARIAEIVIQDQSVLNSTRISYTYYRNLGIDVTTHHIGKQ